MQYFSPLFQDVGASAKEFASVSGKYSMELIVGDAVIENPFSWHLVSFSVYLFTQVYIVDNIS